MSRQPPANTPLDWSNPLTKGIDWAYNFATGVTGAPSQGKNIITPDIVDFTDSVSNTGRWGFVRHMVTSESATDRWDSKYIASYQTGDMTVMVLCRFPTGATQGTIISQREGANQNWQLYWDTNDLTWRGVGLASIGTGAYEADTWMMIGAYCNGSDTWGYKNGVQLGTSGIYVNSPSTPRPISIGHRWDTYPTAAYEGTMHAALAVIWRRQLSAAEHISFAANPWQIFKRSKFALADVPDDVRFLPVEKPWKKQPPAGTPIDWGNPLTKSMVACFVFNEESGNLRDRVKSRSITQGGTPDRITTPQGLAHAFGGTSDRYVVPNSSELNATGDFTVVVGFTNQEVGQNVEIVEKQSGNPMWQIYNSATGNNLEFYGRDSAGTLITLDSVTTLDVGKYVQAAGVKSVANDRVYLYINGYLEDDAEDTSTGDWSNTADMLIADGSAAGMFNGYIHYLYIFQDAKDAEQIARIHENPWQIFKPQIIHAPADVALPDLATFEKWR